MSQKSGINNLSSESEENDASDLGKEEQNHDLGGMLGADIEAMALLVTSHAAKDAQEDLKGIMAGDGAKSQEQEGQGLDLSTMDVESAAHFVMMQAAKGSEDELHDLAGEMNDLKNKKKNGRLIALGVGLIMMLGLLFGVRSWNSSRDDSNTGSQNVANINPSSIALIPISACSISFTTPSTTTEIPDYGPVEFAWTTADGAFAYSLEVAPPAESGPPWVFPTDGTSKKVYMENFPSGGDYQVSINALAENGEILCSAVLTFSKAANDSTAKEKDDGSGANSEPCVSTGMFDQCP